MTALKMLTAGVLLAGAVTLADVPTVQAGPSAPSQMHFVGNDPDELPCGDQGCAPQPPAAAPQRPRGVLGCVRGVCIPKPNPPKAKPPR